MNLASYTDFPIAPVKIHGIGKALKAPTHGVVARILLRMGNFILPGLNRPTKRGIGEDNPTPSRFSLGGLFYNFNTDCKYQFYTFN